MSTVEKGDELRDYVAKLLRAAQYLNVEVERRIGSKKVDVYFESSAWRRSQRTVVECKNYLKPLTKEYVRRHVIPDYQQLISNNYVDNVYVIAPQEISPDTRVYLQEYKIDFFTIEEFQSSLMDFTGYLNGLRAAYDEGGLRDYYMKPHYDKGVDLEDELSEWVGNSDYQPIAILAGYGMGKTSFAKHFSSKLSDEYVAGTTNRIPIYIRLGDISSEQSLEGLLGKVLASSRGVVRYNYELFMELNREGLFVILLDGFDEMKHALSWDEFKFNFEELKKLLEGKSKVVMLGRPSAFLSDYEYSLVIKGVKRIKDKELRSFEWVSYREIDLDMFTVERAYEFIGKYIGYNVCSVSRSKSLLGDVSVSEFLAARILEIKQLKVQELIQRPVQAKMLADIAGNPKNELWNYSRYELYKIFLDDIIDREMKKPSRRVFGAKQRRTFIREVAWWLWNDSAASGFGSGELPRSLLQKYSEGKEFKNDEILRDLISGSILEAKNADNFYFPHRSYQEFLVSEFILNAQWSSSNLTDISSAVSPEVVAFLKESVDGDFITSMCESLLDFKGGIKFLFLEYVASGLKSVGKGKISVDFYESPWGVVISYLETLNVQSLGQSVIEVQDLLFRVFQKTHSRDVRLMGLLCLILSFSYIKPEAKISLKTRIAALILVCSIEDLDKIVASGKGKKKNQIAIPDGRSAPFIRLILVAFKADFNSGELVLEVDFSAIFSELQAILSPNYKIFGLDKIEQEEVLVGYRMLSGYHEELTISEKGALIVNYFKEYHDPENMVQVSHKLAKRTGPRFLREDRDD